MVLQTGGQEERDPVDARCREARPSPSQSRTQRDAVPTGGLGPDELPPRGIETTRALAGWSASVFLPRPAGASQAPPSAVFTSMDTDCETNGQALDTRPRLRALRQPTPGDVPDEPRR